MEEYKENKKAFFDRLVYKLSPTDFTRVKAAYIFSKFGHRAQCRKELDAEGNKLRYFEHPRRVAIIAMDELHIYNPDVIITCLLHDCLEDTEDITSDMIEYYFGKEVCSNVLYLTKHQDEDYIQKLLYAPLDVIVIKAMDRLDNLRSLGPGTELSFRNKIRNETREKYMSFFSSKLSEHYGRLLTLLGQNLHEG
jgi:(p)ppGpp synthase/HD superfamily hydrolase